MTGWPIFGRIMETDLDPFIIGVYGNAKPESAKQFLSTFCEEFLHIKRSGGICFPFDRSNKEVLKFEVKIAYFVMDAPAHSFVSYTLGHNGAHGCPRCDGLRW